MSAQPHLGEGAGSMLPGLDVIEGLNAMMAEGLTGGGHTLVAPLPDLIELAPEVPAGIHLPPRHTPGEIGVWMAGQAMAARVAERRLAQ
jgi:hypothetical protein